MPNPDDGKPVDGLRDFFAARAKQEGLRRLPKAEQQKLRQAQRLRDDAHRNVLAEYGRLEKAAKKALVAFDGGDDLRELENQLAKRLALLRSFVVLWDGSCSIPYHSFLRSHVARLVDRFDREVLWFLVETFATAQVPEISSSFSSQDWALLKSTAIVLRKRTREQSEDKPDYGAIPTAQSTLRDPGLHVVVTVTPGARPSAKFEVVLVGKRGRPIKSHSVNKGVYNAALVLEGLRHEGSSVRFNYETLIKYVSKRRGDGKPIEWEGDINAEISRVRRAEERVTGNRDGIFAGGKNGLSTPLPAEYIHFM